MKPQLSEHAAKGDQTDTHKKKIHVMNPNISTGT